MTTGTDLDSVTLDLDPITTAIGVVAARTLVEVAPDHSTDLPVATSHVTEAPVPMPPLQNTPLQTLVSQEHFPRLQQIST